MSSSMPCPTRKPETKKVKVTWTRKEGSLYTREISIEKQSKSRKGRHEWEREREREIPERKRERERRSESRAEREEWRWWADQFTTHGLIEVPSGVALFGASFAAIGVGAIEVVDWIGGRERVVAMAQHGGVMPGTNTGASAGNALSWVPVVVSALVVAHLFALVCTPLILMRAVSLFF